MVGFGDIFAIMDTNSKILEVGICFIAGDALSDATILGTKKGLC